MRRDPLKITRFSQDKLRRQMWGFSVRWPTSDDLRNGNLTPRIECESYEEAERESLKHRAWKPTRRLLYGGHYPGFGISDRMDDWFDLSRGGSYGWEVGDLRSCTPYVTTERPPLPADLVADLVHRFQPVAINAEPTPRQVAPS
jgi:hypothetical protein